jgi:hypothetical protein
LTRKARNPNDQAVTLHDTGTWRARARCAGKLANVQDVAFGPDGLLAACGSRGNVVVWGEDDWR